MNTAVLLIGPQGIGKTRLAAALMQATGATALMDDWNGGQLPAGSLALTCDDSAAQRAPIGTTIYRVGSAADLQRLLAALCPVCGDCQHYKGRLLYSLDSGCKHPVNMQWNNIDGHHILVVTCAHMRAAGGACGPSGRLFSRATEGRRYWPLSDVFAGTTAADQSSS